MTLTDDVTLLVERIMATRRREAVIRAGKVASTSPLEVILWGDTVAVPAGLRNNAYTPAAGDKVLIFHIPPQLVVWGKIVAS